MLNRLLALYRQKGYTIDRRPYALNLLGERSKSTMANRFDDRLHVFYHTGQRWAYHRFAITTDPGTYWLQNPMMPQGTAILAEGQYQDTYQIGKHRGQYYALVQGSKPVTVIRDYDRNALLDFNNGRKMPGYGINIHRARQQGQTHAIDAYSAGCQVFRDAGDFAAFMAMAEKHRQLYGNSFTYALVDFRALRRIARKRLAAGTALLAVAVAATLNHKQFFQPHFFKLK